MGVGGTYALVTFLVGVELLLGWLYATSDNARSGAILKKSLLIFVFPILLVPGTFSPWAWVACEEGLKTFASTREENRNNRFWLISLFGIWELALDKPFWGLILAGSQETLDRVDLAGLVYATALPVVMHTVTAAIYAYVFEKRLWAAFIVCWVLHVSFNEAVAYFKLSPTAAVVETIILASILAAILLREARRMATQAQV